MNAGQYIDAEMRYEEYTQGHKGRGEYINDPLNPNQIYKPFNFLKRPGVTHYKQKLEARSTMTVLEFIESTMRLILHPRGCHPGDRKYIMDHIQDVARDAQERPWPTVRRWSQEIWDDIEAGDLEWHMTQEIFNRRMLAGLPTTSAPPLTKSGGGAKPHRAEALAQQPICRRFNSRDGCSHQEHHDGLLHYCTYCDSKGMECHHSVQKCIRKEFDAKQGAKNNKGDNRKDRPKQSTETPKNAQ